MATVTHAARRTTREAAEEQARIIAALDHSPLTRRHKVFLAALLAALVFDYMKPATLSFVIPGVRETFALTSAQSGYLAVAGLAGNVVGAVLFGFLGDRIGRRTALLWTVGIFTFASLCGLSMMYDHALMMCFIMGVGVGGEVPIVFALASEYIPVRVRGKTLLFLGIAGSIGGYALAAATSGVIKSFFPESTAWRALWLVGFVPAALVLALRARVVPESARYLVARGRIAEARAAAESVVGPLEAVPTPPRVAARAPARRVGGLWGRTLALGFFSFAWGLASFGLIIWLPTMLGTLGWGGAASSGYLALSALIALPALIVTTALFTRWSSRGTLVAYAAGGGAMLLVLATGTLYGVVSPLFLIVVSGLAFFFINSIGGAFALYASEVYPTEMRTGRTGLVAAAGKFGGVVGPLMGSLWLATHASTSGLFFALAASLFAAAVTLALAGVETRGRSLEEIVADG